MRFLRLSVLALGLVSFVGSVRAGNETASWSPTGFIQTLSAPDLSAAGLNKLTADQVTALNASVAREVSAARAGNVRGFAGTFVGRRSAEERAKIGLDALTTQEQARLNSLVALALANGPVRPDFSASLGKNALDVINRLEIHGEVSLTVGTSGHGRNFYDTSFFTTITDPETNVTVGVGFQQFKGKGWYGYGPDDYYLYDDAGFPVRGFGTADAFHRR